MTEREFGLAAIDDIIRDSVTGRERQSVRWESFTEEFIESIKTAKVFVDCGAEYGFYIRLALKYGPADIRIFAFEPELERYGLLRDSLTMFENVLVFPFAVIDKASTLFGKKSAPGFSISIGGNGELHMFEGIELDDIVLDAKVDVLKMDIEGAEDLAFKGMTKVLENKPKLFVEFHPFSVVLDGEYDPNARIHTIQLLRSAGYDARVVDSGRVVLCAE